MQVARTGFMLTLVTTLISANILAESYVPFPAPEHLAWHLFMGQNCGAHFDPTFYPAGLGPSVRINPHNPLAGTIDEKAHKQFMFERIHGLPAGTDPAAFFAQYGEGMDSVILRFLELSQHSRLSTKEHSVADAVVAYVQMLNQEPGAENRYYAERDAHGNVYIRVTPPESERDPTLEPLAFQGHTDIVPNVDAELLRANPGQDKQKFYGAGARNFSYDTDAAGEGRLFGYQKKHAAGFDEGISLGMKLELIANRRYHKRILEFVLTADEEIGFTGIFNFKQPLLSKVIINLDGEDPGDLYTGALGSMLAKGSKSLAGSDVKPLFMERAKIFDLNLSGLLGGHSGVNARKGGTNAIMLGQFLLAVLHERFPDLALITADIPDGGFLTNIPKSFHLRFATADAGLKALGEEVERFKAWALTMFKNEVENNDFKLELTEVPGPLPLTPLLAGAELRNFYGLFVDQVEQREFPTGPLERFKSFEDVVRSSANLATFELVHTARRGFWLDIQVHGRIGEVGNADRVSAFIIESLQKRGFITENAGRVDFWNSTPEANALGELIIALNQQIVADDPRQLPLTNLGIAPGTLEAGVLVNKNPGAVAVCLPVDVRRAHESDESTGLKSIGQTWRLVERLILTKF